MKKVFFLIITLTMFAFSVVGVNAQNNKPVNNKTLHIEFDLELNNGTFKCGDVDADGCYIREENKIILNTQMPSNRVAEILIHEIWHSIEAQNNLPSFTFEPVDTYGEINNYENAATSWVRFIINNDWLNLYRPLSWLYFNNLFK